MLVDFGDPDITILRQNSPEPIFLSLTNLTHCSKPWGIVFSIMLLL